MTTPTRRSARNAAAAGDNSSSSETPVKKRANGSERGNRPNVYFFIPNLIGYARVVLCGVSLYALPFSPGIFFWCYAISALLDAVDGHAARYFGQSTKFGAVLDMVTDRSATTCLLTYLASVKPEYMLPAQFLIALDLSSHYMHMVSSLSAGAESHKVIAEGGNRLLKIYYSNRYVLFTVCFGNESFFILFYLLHTLSAGLLYDLVYIATLICLPVCILKQYLNIIQLWSATETLVHTDERDWIARQKGEAGS